MELKRSIALVSILIIGSLLLGRVIPMFIPASGDVNSHSLQIGQVMGYVTIHITVPGKSLTYECTVPTVYGGTVSTNPASVPDPSNSVFIDFTDSSLCHQVNG